MLFAGALAATGALIVSQLRPADQDELKIPVSELRSQSFELTLLNQQVARGISPRFIEAQAGQLAQTITRSRQELASLKTLPGLKQSQEAATRQSQPLVHAVGELSGASSSREPARAEPGERVGAVLKALEKTLER